MVFRPGGGGLRRERPAHREALAACRRLSSEERSQSLDAGPRSRGGSGRRPSTGFPQRAGQPPDVLCSPAAGCPREQVLLAPDGGSHDWILADVPQKSEFNTEEALAGKEHLPRDVLGLARVPDPVHHQAYRLLGAVLG